MGQVSLRALHLLPRPAVALLWLGVAGSGAALSWLPLFEVPGYELSSALALTVGLLGGGIGIAAARLERTMLVGRDERPSGITRFDSQLRSVLLPILAGALLNVTALLIPVGVSIFRAFASTRCNPFAQVGFFPALALPSAAIAAAAGAFCGFLATRARNAALAYAALVVLSLLWSAWPIFFGPQVYAFNHFAGYVPGPIYDEELAVTPALLWYRAQTLLLAGALCALSAFLLDTREGRLRRPFLRPGALLVLGACLAPAVWIHERGPSLGNRMTHAYLAEKLGGARDTKHFRLIYPRGKPRHEVEQLVRDLEFHHARLSAFFGKAPEGRIQVFVYRSPEEKRFLVGASRTQFAKPWLKELHLNDGPFPHPVLGHELAHVIAAPLGRGPFRVTSRFGIWPNVGVIEGMAVAAENPTDELTLHEWAAAMRREGLMPEVRTLLGPSGFYGAPASRAYVAAGSLLRYLADTYGPEKLGALYEKGDFEGAYGRPLASLAAEWEGFLDMQPLDEAQVNLAFGRFRQGSLFSRPCAREVAKLSANAAEYLHSDPSLAAALYRRCAELQPDEPSFALGEANALAKAELRGDAASLLAALAERFKDEPAIAAEVAMAMANLAHQREKPAEARTHLERVLSLHPTGSLERVALVKLAALSGGRAGEALWAYFQPGQDEAKLLLLREALEENPQSPYVAYLLGRRLASVAPALALGYLRASLQGGLQGSLRKEAKRLELEAEYLSGDCRAVRDSVGRLEDFGAAFKAAAKTWLDRCGFEEGAFGGPLVPEGTFR